MHYFYVAASILASYVPTERQSSMLASTIWNPKDQTSIQGLLQYYALQICGIAFTTNIPSVLVNAYGPISFCKR